MVGRRNKDAGKEHRPIMRNGIVSTNNKAANYGGDAVHSIPKRGCGWVTCGNNAVDMPRTTLTKENKETSTEK